VVCNQVLYFAPITDLQIKFLEPEHPSNQPRLGFCLLQQVLKSCMVSKYNNRRTKLIRFKLLKRKNTRKKLLLCCGVVCLGNIQSLGGVVDYLWLLINPLSQNNPQCIIGCIPHKLEWGCPIERLNDRSGGQGLLGATKSLFAFVTENELNIFLQQIGQWKAFLLKS